MSVTTRAGILAGAAALTLTGGSLAEPVKESGTQVLKARIAELESRLAAVERADGEKWLTEQRADEIRGIVRDVLADADQRASLLSQSLTAGWDDSGGGFILSSSDGNWELRTNLLMQQRFLVNYTQGSGAAATGDDTAYGFENTRTRFTLSGHVVNRNWFYEIQTDIGTNGGGLSNLATAGVLTDTRTGTLNAYAGYDFDNGWKVYGGQFVNPFLREELIDAGAQLAVERSIVNYAFTTGRVDGIGVDWQSDQFHFAGSFNDGSRTGGSTALTPTTRYAFTGRVEWKAMGTWEQFADLTSSRNQENGILVGGAIHVQQAQDEATALTDSTIASLTVDIQAEFKSVSFFGAVVYSSIDNSGVSPDQDALGVVLQGGYYFTDDWEGFLRYEFADLDTAAVDEISVGTIGVNYYIARHNAKWTTDVGFGLNEVASAAGITGYRTDSAGNDGQVVFRTQLQIAF